jgi:quercetin dioxygenase-like cupin family protein
LVRILQNVSGEWVYCLPEPLRRYEGALEEEVTEAKSIKIELARGDLTAKNMDIIVNLFEVPPGATVAKHTHPGEEIVYVIDGGTFREPEGTLVTFEAGAALIYARGVPHAGFTVVGDRPVRMLNVFVVDKGKPLTELV